MDELLTNLEAEYCPPLDPALLSAILSDFDLSVEDNVQQARLTLGLLKEDATLEEQAGFDASGTGGARDEGILADSRAESCPGTSTSLSRDTDLTSISNGLSSIDLGHNTDDTATTSEISDDLDSLDEDTKIRLLLDVFKNRTSRYNAQYTLRKCGGKWHAAMEELLTHVFFEEAENSDNGEKVRAKGIDGFAEDRAIRKSRKGKAKKNCLKLDERRSSSLPVSPVDPPGPKPNKWKSSSQDVEFITSRMNRPTKTVTSIYHNTGGSLPKTIAVILKDSVHEDEISEDPIQAVNTRDLKVDFPSITSEYAAAIVRLTHPSTAAAHEIANALTARPHVTEGGIWVTPNYARPWLDEVDTGNSQDRKRGSSRGTPEQSPVDGPGAIERASAYAVARSTALSQARAAHRKAKSNPLMGGAAAYYSDLGREYGALSLQEKAVAADALADAQSTSKQVDLHGIDVLNAVRIAREKVEQWWEGLGEHRTNGRVGAAERQIGFTIVVGLGRHSEGGKSKLGPAVSRSLKEHGWKIEPAGPVIVVKGRARA